MAGIDSLSSSDVYDLSFEAHYRIVTIHPWSDGNGRVARLLMNLVQMEGGVVPSFVRSEHRADYIRALQESQEAGSPEPFSSFMADEVATIFRQEIDEYASDIAGDVPWIGEPATEVTPQVTPKSPPKSEPSLFRLEKRN